MKTQIISLNGQCQRIFQRAGRFELIYVKEFYLNGFSDGCQKGYILEIDLEYSRNYSILSIILL